MPSKDSMGINSLPIEILDSLLWFLDLEAAASLRLTCRELAAKSYATSTFKAYFRNKTVNTADVNQLKVFNWITQPDQLGCLLENLSLVSGIPPKDGLGPTLGKLLTQSLINLRTNSRHGCLRSLILQTVEPPMDQFLVESLPMDVEVPDWRETWREAGRVFTIAMRALSTSNIHIKHLDIFGSISRCSLACNVVAEQLPTMNLTPSFSTLASISLSISHHYINRGRDRRAHRSAATALEYAQAVASMIQMAPRLQDFQLHWYRLEVLQPNHAFSVESRFFNHVVRPCLFETVTSCTLRGICTDEATLLAFVQKAPLKIVNFHKIELRRGRYQPIFDHVRPQLDGILLKDLFEYSTLICFDVLGEMPFPTTIRNGPSSLTRYGISAREKISYRLMQGRATNSPEYRKWRQEIRALYGPPEGNVW